jgi:hypothetical protein
MANTKSLVLASLVLAIAIGLAVPILNQANAVLPTASASYRNHGTLTGSTAAAVSKEIYLYSGTSLSWVLTATGGNFNSTTLTVSVSEDGTNWKAVDTISLSTATIKGGTYSISTKASTVAVNVVDFPYVKFATSAGVGSVVEKLTWSVK